MRSEQCEQLEWLASFDRSDHRTGRKWHHTDNTIGTLLKHFRSLNRSVCNYASAIGGHNTYLGVPAFSPAWHTDSLGDQQLADLIYFLGVSSC